MSKNPAKPLQDSCNSTIGHPKMKRESSSYVATYPSVISKKRRKIHEEAEEGGNSVQGNKISLGSPWSNLKIIISLQNREIELSRKIEIALMHVKSFTSVGESKNEDDSHQTVKRSGLVKFLSEWVQSLLVSVEKKVDGNESVEPCLDHRCWMVFKFCLEESSKSNVRLSLSRNLLRAIGFVARSEQFTGTRNYLFLEDDIKLRQLAVDCVSLIFVSHNGVTDGNLDLWISSIFPVLKHINELLSQRIESNNVFYLSSQFASLLLEAFAKFLRAHPMKKNGFRDFVDKLLEPLLILLNSLKDRPNCNRLSTSVEEVILFGLFHTAHVNGFLTLCSTEHGKESKSDLRSYHRHFFIKVNSLSAVNETAALGGLHKLFFLLCNSVKKQRVKESSEFAEDIKILFNEDKSFKNRNTHSEKSTFNFFVGMMEPLLLKMEHLLLENFHPTSLLSSADVIMNAISNLLAVLITEKLYHKTADHSDGFLLNFLTRIYDTVFSSGIKLSFIYVKNKGVMVQENINSLASNILLSIKFLLEINYEVMQNNVESLWLLIFKLLSITSPSINSFEKCPLVLRILDLGRKIITLYSELRQVDVSLFAFCEAVRSIIGTVHLSDYMPEEISFLHERVVKTVVIFICSEEIQYAIRHGFEFIPEGQVSGIIKQIADDAIKSMEWLKLGFRPEGSEHEDFEAPLFRARAELMGRAISDVYAGTLDSLTVTCGNSVLVYHTIEGFKNKLRVYLSTLAHPNNGNDFLCTVLGDSVIESHKILDVKSSFKWIFVFLFRVYISLRSSYKQCIFRLPPKISKAAAEVLRDDLIACAGCNWIYQSVPNRDGYFSWMCHPSSSLLDMIQSISKAYLNADDTDCFSLEYLFFEMAMQRLFDLNRKVNASEYAEQAADVALKSKTSENVDTKILKNKRNEWKKYSITLKDEASRIAEYLLSFLSLPKTDFGAHLNAREESLIECNSRFLIGGFLTEESLFLAIWEMLCQNLNIWSVHASNKKTKYFLERLFFFSLLREEADPSVEGKISNKIFVQKKLNQKSLSILNEATFFDHEFVSRKLSSVICHYLELYFPALRLDSFVGEVAWSCNNCWRDVLSELKMLLNTVIKKKPNLSDDNKPLTGSLTCEVSHSRILACEWLLGFICRIPGRCMKSKSSSRYAKYLLNFERKIITVLIEFHKILSLHEIQKLTKLFVTIRRTLKFILSEHCDKKAKQQDFYQIPTFSDDPYTILWLFKSVLLVSKVIDFMSDDVLSGVFFSLMDHSSETFLIISKYLVSKGGHTANYDSSAYHRTWKGVLHALKIISDLYEQTAGLNLKFSENLDQGANGTLSVCSIALSFGVGFLCGLNSALENTDSKATLINWMVEPFSKIKCFIGKLAEFSTYFLQIFCSNKRCNRSTPNDNSLGIDMIEREMDKLGQNCSLMFDALKNQGNDIDGSQCYCSHPILNNLFDKFLERRFLEEAILIRNLLITSSAFFRFKRSNCFIEAPPITTGFIVSQLLLSKFSDSVVVGPITFVWLDGAEQCLYDLAMDIFLKNPAQTRTVYTNMVQLHLKALGKCISFQGKRACLASHETESNEEIYNSVVTSECLTAKYAIEFKAKLRNTLVCLIKPVSELHLLSALQTLEKSVLGANEGCGSIYGVVRDSSKGRVSSIVAAAIDFLDLILEHVSGRKRINLVKKFVPSLVAALFSVTLHLQTPYLFFVQATDNHYPDPGAVVLMSIEVLTRISAKRTLLQIDSWHIAELLRLPHLLFKDFVSLRALDTSEENNPEHNSSSIDRHFFCKLYAACCKLLYTTLKHQKRETDQCIAMLQDSTRLLLCCLEIDIDFPPENRRFFSYGLQEARECACFFRRIFEELRQQKDVFARHCYKFLSDYLWIYCGNGPLKCGIRREIDDALRPGVYALLDASSTEDLQYLHSGLGEGPCRSTLATLQHDYQLHFRYEGKV